MSDTKRELMDRIDITLSTELGPFAVDIRDEAHGSFRLLPANGKMYLGAAGVDGKMYHIKGSIQLVDGAWVITRTEKGNESAACFNVSDIDSRGYAEAGKKVRDRVRAVVLGAINEHLAAHPELVAQARKARINNAILDNNRRIAELLAKVEQLTAENLKLMKEEER